MKFQRGRPLHVYLQFAPSERVFVGRLAMDGNRGVFEYAVDFAKHGMELSPLSPQHGRGLHYATKPRDFEGLPAIFGDSLPDAWGQALMRRLCQNEQISFLSLSALDKLSIVGRRGPGALVYEPSTDRSSAIDLNLDALARASTVILDEGETPRLRQLERVGGSSGGARPKALIGLNPLGEIVSGDDELPDGFEAWIVKFPSSGNDPADAGPLEAAFADMARAGGLDVAPTQLLPARDSRYGYFATQRFDRLNGNRRFHMSSVCALAQAPWEYASIDYSDLHNIVRYVTRDHQAVVEVFRRMVFNVLANNRDDHTKQHAFLMNERGEWRLAPAYDLTFSSGPGNQHYLAVNGRGGDDIRLHDLLEVGRSQHIAESTMQTIFDQVSTAVMRFNEFASRYSASAPMQQEVSRVLTARMQHLGGRTVAIGQGPQSHRGAGMKQREQRGRLR